MVGPIRDVEPADLTQVLTINNAASTHVSELDHTQLKTLYDNADYFRVVQVDQSPAAFLIALASHQSYDDSAFCWFKQHYPQFLFIDRIVVAANYHRHGLGRLLYADVQSFAEPRSPLLATAVTLGLNNDVAVLFHGSHGFHEVGQLVTANAQRRGLLSKPLPCYDFVHRRYGDTLPDVPWLHTRQPVHNSTSDHNG